MTGDVEITSLCISFLKAKIFQEWDGYVEGQICYWPMMTGNHLENFPFGNLTFKIQYMKSKYQDYNFNTKFGGRIGQIFAFLALS